MLTYFNLHLLFSHSGYGHITPETPLGQILTVVYCFIGLPIAMLALKTLGEIVSKMAYTVVFIVETKVLCKKTPRKVKIKSFFITFTLMLLSLCAGGVTHIYMEDGTFIEGVYSWFATLSTIGYGDYIPTWSLMQNTEESHQTLWLVVSALSLPSLALLSVVSGVLNSLVEAIEEFKIQCKSCYKCPRCQKKKSAGHKEPQKAKSVGGGAILDESKEDLTVHKERLRSSTV